MIKVAIFKTFGQQIYPKSIEEKIKGKSFLDIRTNVLVEHIEKIESVENFEDVMDRLEAMEVDDEFRFKNSLYFMADWYYSRIEIVTVDNSRPWTITSYDGAESIEYSKPVILDETLNYYEFKED